MNPVSFCTYVIREFYVLADRAKSDGMCNGKDISCLYSVRKLIAEVNRRFLYQMTNNNSLYIHTQPWVSWKATYGIFLLRDPALFLIFFIWKCQNIRPRIIDLLCIVLVSIIAMMTIPGLLHDVKSRTALYGSNCFEHTYTHLWNGSSLFKVMAFRLFGTKPLNAPVLTHCQLGP